MDEPYVQSTTYVYDPTATCRWRRATARRSPRTAAPIATGCRTSCPGQNTALTEWLKNEPWMPEAAARGGVKTIYPEYRATLNGSGGARAR